jgi:hypothetical protein
MSTLLLMAVSELLESVLCSSHDTTAPDRFEQITASISEGYGSLMEMLRSPCALVVENAALLIQMIANHKPRVSTLIRDAALSSATLLRHLYNAIFSPSSSQRFLSRYLVTLWMSGAPNCPEKLLLSRILPSGFIPYLQVRRARERREREKDIRHCQHTGANDRRRQATPRARAEWGSRPAPTTLPCSLARDTPPTTSFVLASRALLFCPPYIVLLRATHHRPLLLCSLLAHSSFAPPSQLPPPNSHLPPP